MKCVYLLWEQDPLACDADELLGVYSSLEAAKKRQSEGSSYGNDLIIEMVEVEE